MCPLQAIFYNSVVFLMYAIEAILHNSIFFLYTTPMIIFNIQVIYIINLTYVQIVFTNIKLSPFSISVISQGLHENLNLLSIECVSILKSNCIKQTDSRKVALIFTSLCYLIVFNFIHEHYIYITPTFSLSFVPHNFPFKTLCL